MKRPLSACLLIAVAFVATAHAELEPLSPEQLRANASHVAIGNVRIMGTEQVKDGQWLKTVGVVEIQVTKLEKGDKIETGDCIYARFWRKGWVGNGKTPPFDSGHQLPKKGDNVRVYLKKTDGGFDALLPNGFEVIPKAAEAKTNQ